MSESFFRRWSRRKAEHAQPDDDANIADAVPPSDAAPGSATAQPDLPSMKDVASLAPDADYSAFLAKGVDKAVRRAAMKKLFSDPHFNRMDGLDIYIDDYTKPSPLPPGMLAALQHAKSTLEPRPLYKTREEEDSERRLAAQADADAAESSPDDEEQRTGEKADDEKSPEPHTDTETQAPAASEASLPPERMPARDASVNPNEFPHP